MIQVKIIERNKWVGYGVSAANSLTFPLSRDHHYLSGSASRRNLTYTAMAGFVLISRNSKVGRKMN